MKEQSQLVFTAKYEMYKIKTNIFFIYVPGLKGVTSEILYGLDQNINSHGKEKKSVLQQHELPTEYKDLRLEQLELIYPYKGKEDEKTINS